MKRTTLCLLLMATLGLRARADTPKAGRKDAAAECKRLQLALVEERAKAIRDDPDIARLHSEILRLYRELDRALLANPVIAKLQAELKDAQEARRKADARK